VFKHRLKKLANTLDRYDEEYMNKNNQITPYHILFKDHGDEIASLDIDSAIRYCFETIESLNEQFGESNDFYKITDDKVEELKQYFNSSEASNGMDVLFAIKDFLLESEGLEIHASRLKKIKK